MSKFSHDANEDDAIAADNASAMIIPQRFLRKQPSQDDARAMTIPRRFLRKQPTLKWNSCVLQSVNASKRHRWNGNTVSPDLSASLGPVSAVFASTHITRN